MRRLIKAALRRVLPPEVLRLMRVAAHRVPREAKFAIFRLGLRRDPPLRQKISLIVAAYNVAPYIDEFLRSAVSQSVGHANLEVLVVDDGSTDDTGRKAQRWARRYPEVIRYFRKENGGVSSARNLGIEHATGDWLSFPDPDDILPPRYLHHVDREIGGEHQAPLLAIAMRLVVFREANGTLKDDHPLTFRFRRARSNVVIRNFGDNLQLHAASFFVCRADLTRHGITFDSRVKPGFEDAHLINRLLLLEPDRSVTFLRRPAYIYRKRLAGTSLIDGGASKREWYLDQIECGVLPLIQLALETWGRVPRFLQRTAVYEIFWKLRVLAEQTSRMPPMTVEEEQRALELLGQVCSHIDASTINDGAPLGPIYEDYRVGLLGMISGSQRPRPIAYVRQFDLVTNEFQIGYFDHREVAPSTDVVSHVGPVATRFHSRRSVRLLGRPFFSEHRFWVSADKPISLSIDGATARFRHRDKVVGTELGASKPGEDAVRRTGQGHWVLMDRVDKADDNAEHLYRYVRQHAPSRKLFFVLKRSTGDWKRLKAEGFHLLDYGSKAHQEALESATVFASSHIDHHVLHPRRHVAYGSSNRPRFVFLDHGVTKDDMSKWFNTKPISTMVAVTSEEYASITSEDSNYLLSSREVVLSGFPRHDSLLARAVGDEPTHVLIMPTWRRYLTDETKSGIIRRQKVPHFAESEYARHWRSVLNSPSLRQSAETRGLEIVFCAHPDMTMYLSDFAAPEWITVRSALDIESLQPLFTGAVALVTDFSSVAFDVAFLNRPVVYYHFDMDKALAGAHAYTRGYFDYGREGFGPVCMTEDEVVRAVDAALSGNESPHYARRRLDTFPFRDGRSCERVYNAILEMLGERPAASGQMTPVESDRVAAQ